ncbi:MAG: serine/threonine protein kinase [Polyangiaceae bacterium]
MANSRPHGLAELERILAPHTQADVTLTYQRFRAEAPAASDDPAQFVAYLVGRGLLPAEAAATVAAEIAAQSTEDATIVEGRRDGSAPRAAERTGPSATTRADSAVLEPIGKVHATNLRLLDVIGRGGMGLVYRGEQVELERMVAYKQLPALDDESTRARFVREARITAQLDHPNIVPVHLLELSPQGAPVGYAMKLVDGKTLRTLLSEAKELELAQKPLPTELSLATRLEHFLRVCDAIAFAHARGVLHRDLKPANIMVGQFGEVYVMDWGVARVMGTREPARSTSAPAPMKNALDDLTQVGDVIGSPSYMSPEQADGRNDELDARSDQYALGLILFELVSLRRALDAESTGEIFELASRGKKAPLEHVVAGKAIAPELVAIIEKATAFAPQNRYASVSDLADDVRRFLRGDEIAARPDNAVARLFRVMNRHRRATLFALFATLALAALLVVGSLYRQTAAELAARQRADQRTALYSDVAAQGHRLDAEFREMEAALEGLRTAAEWALEGPEQSGDAARFYFDSDFADAARRPADFTSDTTYRWPVSIDYPVVGVAPGTDRALVRKKIERLAPLRNHMRAMFIGAAEVEASSLSAAEQRSFLLNRRGPIDYAYVDSPEGVHFVYPGMASLTADYDVRTSGFYQMSANKHGRRWGSPYIDSTTDEQGDDLVLPCTQGLWSRSGEFLGVAGVEITVTKIVERGLSLPNHATLRTSLVDGEGKKVIDSDDAGKRFKASGKDEGMTLYDFDIPEIVSAIKSGAEGLREVERAGRPLVVVFVQIEALGWYYVVEVDRTTLAR